MKNLSFLGILSRISFVAALVTLVHMVGWILPPLFIADRTLLGVSFEELVNRHPQELLAPLIRVTLFMIITLTFSFSQLLERLVRNILSRKNTQAVVATDDRVELTITYRWL